MSLWLNGAGDAGNCGLTTHSAGLMAEVSSLRVEIGLVRGVAKAEDVQLGV